MVRLLKKILLEFACRLRENLSRETRIHFRLGKKFLKELNYKRAEKEFIQVLRRDPGHFRAHVYLAKIYKHIENFTDALKELTIAFKLNPARYSSYNLDKERQELICGSPDKNLPLNLSLNLKKCASNLSEAAKRMHIVLSKQQKLIDHLSRLDRPVSHKKGKGDKSEADDSKIEAVEKMIDEMWVSKEKSGRKGHLGKTRSNIGPYGDFSSAEELKKFKKMPPISREEIDDMDWDELLDQDW